jgi:hypothetical protein
MWRISCELGRGLARFLSNGREHEHEHYE